jgi:uncharacterized protein
MNKTTKPKPERNSTNAPMLDAWRSGRFVVQRCLACRRSFFYPRSMCPHCWSTLSEWVEHSSAVVICSTRIMRPIDDSFRGDVPLTLAELELTDGLRFLARVVTTEDVPAPAGATVTLVSADCAPSFPLPTFEVRRS